MPLEAETKDLTQTPPRSPRERLGGFVVLGRAIDKCRAEMNGKVGEYKYNCPLDQNLFEFKGIDGEQLKQVVANASTDEEIANWLKENGTPKTESEIQEWSDQMDKVSLYDDPEKREWFSEECRKLGLDPASTTLFEWLEADDRASFKG